MSSSRRIGLALLIAAAFAACDLNPQPLPPGDDRENAAAPKSPENPGGGFGGGPNSDGSPTGDAGSNNEGGVPAPEDAGTDGGDAGDASTDATTD